MNIDTIDREYIKFDIRTKGRRVGGTVHDVSILLRLFKKLGFKFFLFKELSLDDFFSISKIYNEQIRVKVFNFINNNVAEKYNLKFKLSEKDEEASIYEKYFITLREFEKIIDYFVNEVHHDNKRKFWITDAEFSVVDENKEPKYWFEMGSDTPFQITVIDKINPEASREILIKALKELKKEIEEEQHKK